ncbi:unnamed protein product [Paramecium octaurelia]|uniref:Uncharacterized protein n=1 Tax=Paramecium octaurelia TaxID=43137 RepID=A0A8S1XWQ2_PAROT|nr:unnamed protein product [Paramecium octaurelia]
MNKKQYNNIITNKHQEILISIQNYLYFFYQDSIRFTQVVFQQANYSKFLSQLCRYNGIEFRVDSQLNENQKMKKYIKQIKSFCLLMLQQVLSQGIITLQIQEVSSQLGQFKPVLPRLFIQFFTSTISKSGDHHFPSSIV